MLFLISSLMSRTLAVILAVLILSWSTRFLPLYGRDWVAEKRGWKCLSAALIAIKLSYESLAIQYISKSKSDVIRSLCIATVLMRLTSYKKQMRQRFTRMQKDMVTMRTERTPDGKVLS